jgi:hypothetical protein
MGIFTDSYLGFTYMYIYTYIHTFIVTFIHLLEMWFGETQEESEEIDVMSHLYIPGRWEHLGCSIAAILFY